MSLYSTDLEIKFDEQDRSEIENAAVPLENDVTLSLRPTQIPFTIEITHATIRRFNLTEFLNTDFTDIVHATSGKISYAGNHVEREDIDVHLKHISLADKISTRAIP